MATKPARAKDAKNAKAAEERLIPPKNSVTVRMYRTGHGDCFLLAFGGEAENKPVYVLIDCGYKPGSPAYIGTDIGEITKSIRAATGGHIDVAIITHEHQDHLNGITAANFHGLTIGETWLAWTEDPNDNLANLLRAKYKDQLLGLLAARNRLQAFGDLDAIAKIDELLTFEIGGTSETFDAAATLTLLAAAGADPAKSMNKQSIKLLKDLARNGVKYISPHEEILSIAGAKGLRIFALGPPRDTNQLQDLDPLGNEEFHGLGLATSSAANYFAAAAAAEPGDRGQSPFASRYCVSFGRALADVDYGQFFTTYYGPSGSAPLSPRGINEAESNPEWRKIDRDWLYSAEQLALDMNCYTNNASLVLAFEIDKGGKVLLFAADAQRGNWASWAKKDWKDGDKTVTARDLLARTVLYKVGHHGSHNATINGSVTDKHPNLSWMATGEHAREFTALITAVRAWAETKKGWDHPQKAIKNALIKKAGGRVLQTDKDFGQITMPDDVAQAHWNSFLSRTRGSAIFFDYTISG